MARSKAVRLASDPLALGRYLYRKHIYRRLYVPLNNALREALARPEAPVDATFDTIRARTRRRSDISDHLPLLYRETVARRPKLMVELGTRGGESTLVLLTAAKAVDAPMVSVDIDDVGPTLQQKEPELTGRWRFVQADDVGFAARFPDYCRQHGLPDSIDLLFIDTSHLYQHTVDEIAAWFPLLRASATVMFHDTAMGEFYRRADGTIDRGWDNARGVIRAIEEALGFRIDEFQPFRGTAGGWTVEHYPHCNGFTVLRRDAA